MNKNANTSIQMIADYDGDIAQLFGESQEGLLPLLATRNMVLFPGVIAPIIIGRLQSLALISELRKRKDPTFCVFC